MALLSNIVVDQSAQTAILTVTKAGNAVETITYTNSTKQVSFALRADITITLIEFLDFISQVNIFQTAILFNYNPSVFLTVPFGSCNNTETHDIALSKWTLVCIYGATPRVVNYSCNIPALTVDLVNRSGAKAIDFPEWIYFLMQLNHYRQSLKAL